MTLKTLVPAALPLAALLLAPSEAAADCKVAKMLDLPVVMAGRRPLVTAQIGGRDARFVVDSGAFYSTLSRASRWPLSRLASGTGAMRATSIEGCGAMKAG